MKFQSSQIIWICVTVCLILFNFGLLYEHSQKKSKLEKIVQSAEYLREIEFAFNISKEITVARFKYEQYNIGNAYIYIGSDKNALIHVSNFVDYPKLVLGLSQDMCSPCVYGVLDDLREFFPDHETNSNIMYVADIEQRFKDNYFNKKVVSFHQKDEFPLYKIGMPYFFILDKDLYVKMLFITDKTSPKLTKEYLKIIKERYPDI